jgi:hypothetical protein
MFFEGVRWMVLGEKGTGLGGGGETLSRTGLEFRPSFRQANNSSIQVL